MRLQRPIYVWDSVTVLPNVTSVQLRHLQRGVVYKCVCGRRWRRAATVVPCPLPLRPSASLSLPPCPGSVLTKRRCVVADVLRSVSVVAVNIQGASDSVWAVFTAAPSPPDAITLGRLLGVAYNYVSLEWTPPSSNGDAISGYRVQYRQTSSSTVRSSAVAWSAAVPPPRPPPPQCS